MDAEALLSAEDLSICVVSFLSLKDLGRLRRVSKQLHRGSPTRGWLIALFHMSRRLQQPLAVRPAERDLQYWAACAQAVQGCHGPQGVLTSEVYVVRGGPPMRFQAERQSFSNAHLWDALPPILPGMFRIGTEFRAVVRWP